MEQAGRVEPCEQGRATKGQRSELKLENTLESSLIFQSSNDATLPIILMTSKNISYQNKQS